MLFNLRLTSTHRRDDSKLIAIFQYSAPLGILGVERHEKRGKLRQFGVFCLQAFKRIVDAGFFGQVHMKFVCADEFAPEGEEFYGDGHRVYELNEKPA